MNDERVRHRTEEGQAFVELALFIALFVLLTLGVVTFGHAFLVVNMVTHAARDGARLAATWTPRASCHGLDSSNTGGGSTGAIEQVVINEIAAVTTATMTVQVSQVPSQVGRTESSGCATPAASDPATVKVRVTGCVPYVLPMFSGCYNIDRAAEFADQGLGTGGGG